MSDLLEQRNGTTRTRTGAPTSGGRRGRLMAMILVLGLLLGGAAGWAAFTVLSEGATRTAEIDGAENVAEPGETRGQEADRLRLEGQADRYAPDWRYR